MANSQPKTAPFDGNQAVAHVAYRVNDVMMVYPITPSSGMAEYADAWASQDQKNLWGAVPSIVEMQSEAGAAGAVHGALMSGSLATTFTASQGLLLMIPNLYKIAGELTSAVFHVAARTIATQGLSIFGDHSDVMAIRQTGWAMLSSSSVQEAMDLALISHAATLESRLPFIHFFDGFRTSHEIAKIEVLPDNVIRAMIDESLVEAHRRRALTPDRPTLRGTSQNPDVHFQARETTNRFYAACPAIVQKQMDRFAQLTGRQYRLFDYYGAPDAERVMVIMGSGAQTARDTVDALLQRGERVGVLTVRLFRPLDAARLVCALPKSVRKLAVMDRTKEPGALGDPLYLDVVTAYQEASPERPKIIGGRFGLSSKEFTPAMVAAIFAHLAADAPKNHFTIGIRDDVTRTSLAFDPSFSVESPRTFRAVFYGLGSDGTVGANKNTIKIISDHTEYYAQGYFVYDSKKAGAVTVSHLRFGPEPIRSAYLVDQAQFVGCHQPVFLERYEMLRHLMDGGAFLLNTSAPPEKAWDTLPKPVQETLIARQARFYVIDAYAIAKAAGLGRRINTIMQVAYFSIANVLPKEKALAEIRAAIKKSYGRKGEEIVQMNLRAVDQALERLQGVPLGTHVTNERGILPAIHGAEDAFIAGVLGPLASGLGESIPVSALPCDGVFPTATTQYEKRNLAQEIPEWDPTVCIQCAKCAIACPHSVIRMKVYDETLLCGAPDAFKSASAMDRDWKGQRYTLQIAPEDCTGCGICVDVCPARQKTDTHLKAINMKPHAERLAPERDSWAFFTKLPEVDRRLIKPGLVRQQQLQRPLFEFSSACSGCGETPYLKLLSQLFGDRALIANATGCSSIYGGNLPTTPWAKDACGRGPAWANSLFEDNAEFGLGFRISLDQHKSYAEQMLKRLAPTVGETLAEAILNAPQKDEADLHEQRARVALLKQKLEGLESLDAQALCRDADYLVKKSVWIVGGDGWAYDIGFGGLDHVLSTGRNVNILVLDTEVYSNTGGQMSKSTPCGAVAKFAAAGKTGQKKDLGLMAMTYGNVYVATIAMGAKDEHTLKAFLEAEAYDGPSLIIAYAHCVAHSIDMSKAMQIQKAAVDSGHWILYRHHPDRLAAGQNPLTLDSSSPRLPLKDYMYQQGRFKMLTKSRPDAAKALLSQAEGSIAERWAFYEFLASRKTTAPPVSPPEVP